MISNIEAGSVKKKDSNCSTEKKGEKIHINPQI